MSTTRTERMVSLTTPEGAAARRAAAARRGLSLSAYIEQATADVDASGNLETYLRAKILHDPEAQAVIRTVQETGSTNTAGLLPVNTAGDLTDFVDPDRPLVRVSNRGAGPRPKPGKGVQFVAGRATQLVQAGTVAEKAQLTSRQLVTAGDTVTFARRGGTIRLTEQVIDWSEPALLDEVKEDLMEQYAIETDADTAAAIVAAATHTTTTASFTDPAVFVPAVVAGITRVRGTSNIQAAADLLLVSGNRWDQLAAMVDADGLPVFPRLATEGPAGLAVVYSFQLPDNFVAVASSRFIRTWEKVYGLVDANVPSNLEVELAYAGDFAVLAFAQGLCEIVAA